MPWLPRTLGLLRSLAICHGRAVARGAAAGVLHRLGLVEDDDAEVVPGQGADVAAQQQGSTIMQQPIIGDPTGSRQFARLAT